MNAALSTNTQAILLLTAPLIIGRRDPDTALLKPSEYRKLARHLRSKKQQPSDLLSRNADTVIEGCNSFIQGERLRKLLNRGFLLSQAVERWNSRAIWVISRADSTYPRRLKQLMKEAAPAILYGCGEMEKLNCGGLGVVGSRKVDDTLLKYTEQIGQLAAQAKANIVSGGAKGIDQASMRGALKAGGCVVGVLAKGLEQEAMKRDNRDALMDGRLSLLSPFDPSAGFNVGNAMQRNKLIYAFSDATLVVNADKNKGGTWAGAVEQLNKLHYVPVYTRSTGQVTDGLTALREKGALPWPNPKGSEALLKLLSTKHELSTQAPAQALLPLTKSTEKPEGIHLKTSMVNNAHSPPKKEQGNIPADALFTTVRRLLHGILSQPQGEKQVAKTLEVSPSQARAWLLRLTDEGLVKRQTRPIVYVRQETWAESSAANIQSPES